MLLVVDTALTSEASVLYRTKSVIQHSFLSKVLIKFNYNFMFAFINNCKHKSLLSMITSSHTNMLC